MSQSNQIVNHQHLSINIRTCTNANRRDVDRGRDLRGQFRRNFLQDDGETTRFLKQYCVLYQFGRLFFLARAHGIRAEFVDGLRREPQMPHHWNARAENSFDGFDDLGTSFQFDGVRSAFLHDADGTVERLS